MRMKIYKIIENRIIIFLSFLSESIKIFLKILNISKIGELYLYNFFCNIKIMNIDLEIKCYSKLFISNFLKNKFNSDIKIDFFYIKLDADRITFSLHLI